MSMHCFDYYSFIEGLEIKQGHISAITVFVIFLPKALWEI